MAEQRVSLEGEAGCAPPALVGRLRKDEEREALRKQVHAVVRETHGVEAVVVLAGNNTLPKTSSGKLSRAKARIMYLEGAFA